MLLRPSLIITLMLAVAGCGKSDDRATAHEPPPEPPPAEAPAAPVPEAPATPTAVGELMRGHFTHASDARLALIRADLPAAKEAMKWLATHKLGESLPVELKPRLDEMQAAAAKFGEAKNMREAGVALATTMSRCGSCHKAAGKGPNIASEPMPDAKDLNSHMQRHHWASRRIWSSLVTASDEALAEGIEALNEAPLDAATLAAVGDQVAKVGALDAHVHKLARDMKSAQTEAEKLEAFGHMLATCAVCHRTMGRGPKPIEAMEPAEPTAPTAPSE